MFSLIMGLLWFAVLSYLAIGTGVATYHHGEFVQVCRIPGRGKTLRAYWIALDVVVWIVNAILWPLVLWSI